MPPKGSEQRFDQGGQTRYLVYESDQRLRNGEMRERIHVRRFYLPADAHDLSMDGLRTLRKRTGRRVHGVEVKYQHLVGGTQAHRGGSSYKSPARWAERTKVIEVPQSARKLRFTDNPPSNSRMAVA
jgi:hypothetical protein